MLTDQVEHAVGAEVLQVAPSRCVGKPTMPGNRAGRVLAALSNQVVDHRSSAGVYAVERHLGQQTPHFGRWSADDAQTGVELAELSEESGAAFMPGDPFDFTREPLAD